MPETTPRVARTPGRRRAGSGAKGVSRKTAAGWRPAPTCWGSVRGIAAW